MRTVAVTTAVGPAEHRLLKKIANRKGWKLRHAANEAVRALQEKITNNSETGAPNPQSLVNSG